MGAQRTAFDGTNPPPTAEIEKQFRDQGHPPRTWSNGLHAGYEQHAHSYHKRLYCTSGGIVFHTGAGAERGAHGCDCARGRCAV